MQVSQNNVNTIDLATGSHEDRQHINQNDIYEQCKELHKEVIEKLELLYDLTLLDGALESDEFLQAKLEFKKVGENYGYIHSYVSRNEKSNIFRFQYRRPSFSGKMIYEGLTISKTKGGYTPSAFKKAGHELEKDLCLMTEKYFLVLRKQSKQIRSALRKLNSLQFNEPVEEE